MSTLKNIRIQKGLTQREVARLAGISERVYQDYEYGKRFPDVRVAIRIGLALGITNVNELWHVTTTA